MTDKEFRESWNFSKMVAINIGSVTLSKEDVLAIDDFINRQREEIERLENSLAISKKETKRYVANYETIKADAVKEFAEKLKQCMESYADDWCWIEMSQISFEEMVDLLVKEFRRGKKHD